VVKKYSVIFSGLSFILLDVRRPDEFASGHIPGAVLFTNELMTKEDAEKLLPNKNQRIFVYFRFTILENGNKGESRA